MAKRIALFNHKAGVSKTTTAFHLGWKLAQMGHRVILVDADPQSSLTRLVLGYGGPETIEEFYRNEPDRNFKSGLAPAFEFRPTIIEPVECLVTSQRGLYLLPGHVALTEYESTLGIAQSLTDSAHSLQNLPGSISRLLEKTAKHLDADYVLVDMNPTLSAFNQNLLMTSDYFIVPTHPDFLSALAIESLAKVISGWRNWSKKAQASPVLRNAIYPFPHATPRFLGTVIHDCCQKDGRVSAANNEMIDALNASVMNRLVPALRDRDMTLPDEEYRLAGLDQYCLAMIPDSDWLIEVSRKRRTPVFNLTVDQTGRAGTTLRTTQESRHKFHQLFADAANKIVALTGNAGSN